MQTSLWFEATKRSYSVPFTNSKHGGVDMCSSLVPLARFSSEIETEIYRFESTISIGYSAASIVVTADFSQRSFPSCQEK